MLVHCDAFRCELLVEEVRIFVGTTTRCVDLATDQVICLNKAEEAVDLIGLEAFEINVVTICQLYYCAKR